MCLFLLFYKKKVSELTNVFTHRLQQHILSAQDTKEAEVATIVFMRLSSSQIYLMDKESIFTCVKNTHYRILEFQLTFVKKVLIKYNLPQLSSIPTRSKPDEEAMVFHTNPFFSLEVHYSSSSKGTYFHGCIKT